MKSLLTFFIALLIPTYSLSAAEDTYHFNNQTEQQRFEVLTSQLRCLVCQNQNLAESNSGLASDLRNEVYQHIQQGDSDKKIIGYLVARYGNFILYRPPFNLATAGLWLAPIFALLLGLAYLIYYIRKQRD